MGKGVDLKVSFVIPAHNEERLLGRTLEALHAAARAAVGEGEYEVIVADDSSTDGTGELARSFASRGTRVVRVENRQISATRNAGAREARGEILIFVDADTLIDAAAVRGVLRAVAGGAVGGGAGIRFDGRVPFWARAATEVFLLAFRMLKWTGGCFLYCTRTAFAQSGGWDEGVYASEEILLCKALKRIGRVHILRERVVTSGRKLRTHSAWEIWWLMLKAGVRGKRMLQTRDGLDLWYGPRREDAEPGA